MPTTRRFASAVTNTELEQLPYSYRTENTSVLPSIRVLPEVQFGNGSDQFSLSGGMGLSERDLGGRHHDHQRARQRCFER